MKVSIEILYHFQCDNCQAWFSIADASLAARISGAGQISCPWCGKDRTAISELPATENKPAHPEGATP